MYHIIHNTSKQGLEFNTFKVFNLAIEYKTTAPQNSLVSYQVKNMFHVSNISFCIYVFVDNKRHNKEDL